MTACVTSLSGVTRCLREASGRSVWRRCSAILVCRDCGICDGAASCREPVMKPVGKPDAGNPYVRFEERGGEMDRSRDTAPLLVSTVEPCLLRCLVHGYRAVHPITLSCDIP